jgi:hypothetical protein
MTMTDRKLRIAGSLVLAFAIPGLWVWRSVEGEQVAQQAIQEKATAEHAAQERADYKARAWQAWTKEMGKRLDTIGEFKNPILKGHTLSVEAASNPDGPDWNRQPLDGSSLAYKQRVDLNGIQHVWGEICERNLATSADECQVEVRN